jgi:lipopolysaccharide exporter
MSIKDQATAGVKWTSVSSTLTATLQALKLVVLAHILKPEDFGLMAMVMITIGFVQAYADAGISSAIVHRQDTTTAQLSSLYWLNVMVGITLFAAVFVLAPLIAAFFNESRLSLLLRTTGLTFLILPWGKQFEVLLQKDLNFRKLALTQVAATAQSTAVAVIIAMLGYGVWALVWSQLSFVAFQAFVFVATGWGRHRVRLHFQKQDLNGYLSFGLYQMGERSINYFVQRIDQLILGYLLGAQTLGYYNFAFNIISITTSQINPVVTRVAFPLFAKVQEDAARLRRGYLMMVRMLTTLNAPLLIGLAVISPTAVPLVFGAQWTDAVVLLQLLSLAALLRSHANPIGSLLLAKGRADKGFRWNVLLIFVTGPAIFAGACVGEGIGAAIALIAVQCFLQWFGYVYLVRPLIGRCGFDYALTLFKPTGMALGMAGVVFSIGWVPIGNWLRLSLQMVTGTGIYLLLMRLFDPHTIDELHGLTLGKRREPEARSHERKGSTSQGSF